MLVCKKCFWNNENFDSFLIALENVLKKWFDSNSRRYMYVCDSGEKKWRMIELYVCYKEKSRRIDEVEGIKPLLNEIDELYKLFFAI